MNEGQFHLLANLILTILENICLKKSILPPLSESETTPSL